MDLIIYIEYTIAIAISNARSLSLFSTRRPPTPSGWGVTSFHASFDKDTTECPNCGCRTFSPTSICRYPDSNSGMAQYIRHKVCILLPFVWPTIYAFYFSSIVPSPQGRGIVLRKRCRSCIPPIGQHA